LMLASETGRGATARNQSRLTAGKDRHYHACGFDNSQHP